MLCAGTPLLYSGHPTRDIFRAHTQTHKHTNISIAAFSLRVQHRCCTFHLGRAAPHGIAEQAARNGGGGGSALCCCWCVVVVRCCRADYKRVSARSLRFFVCTRAATCQRGVRSVADVPPDISWAVLTVMCPCNPAALQRSRTCRRQNGPRCATGGNNVSELRRERKTFIKRASKLFPPR